MFHQWDEQVKHHSKIIWSRIKKTLQTYPGKRCQYFMHKIPITKLKLSFKACEWYLHKQTSTKIECSLTPRINSAYLLELNSCIVLSITSFWHITSLDLALVSQPQLPGAFSTSHESKTDYFPPINSDWLPLFTTQAIWVKDVGMTEIGSSSLTFWISSIQEDALLYISWTSHRTSDLSPQSTASYRFLSLVFDYLYLQFLQDKMKWQKTKTKKPKLHLDTGSVLYIILNDICQWKNIHVNKQMHW